MSTLGEINRILHVESRRRVAPLYWSADSYDANTVKNNGSCFAVEIGATRFGVTAHHVIEKFLRIRNLEPSTRLMVRNTDISDWEDRFIDGDAGLDVATFHLTEAEILDSEIQMFRHAAEKWPPPPPQVDRGVFLMGYPGEGRRVLNNKSVEFSSRASPMAWFSHPLVLRNWKCASIGKICTISMEVRFSRSNTIWGDLAVRRGLPLISGPTLKLELGAG